MIRRYATADVFTREARKGNPVAVVLDAAGLTTAQMQSLAIEFNYVETTFVLPPTEGAHDAEVRIFTPEREIPFAGHPNIGTAFLLARTATPAPERLVFEEKAGLVRITVLTENGEVVGAELLAPEPFAAGAALSAAEAAALLGLDAAEVVASRHPPRRVSVGLPFLAVELASREALRRARPNGDALARTLPFDGAGSVYAYTRDVGTDAAGPGCDIQSRMFTRRTVEDPATGSATAAVTGLIASLEGDDVSLRVSQGVDMGRPSLLRTRTVRENAAIRVFLAGDCAPMFTGSFEL